MCMRSIGTCEYKVIVILNKYYHLMNNNISSDSDSDSSSTSMEYIDKFSDESESKSEDDEPIKQTRSPSELINHLNDLNLDKFKKSQYIRREKRIVEIKSIPQHEQKSVKWLKQRETCLTATAIAIALDEDPYKTPAYLLLDKCGRCPKFVANKFTHHGNKYETIASMYYSFRNNINMAEYGMIKHSKQKFIGASPDGICERSTLDGKGLSSLVGRLLEIKCPACRPIKFIGDLDGDRCPHQYFVQVQTQLFVTEMDECDFLQCKITEYESWEEYLSDSDKEIPTLSKKTHLEKGCIIQLLPRKLNSGFGTVWNTDIECIDATDPEITDEYLKHLFEAKYIYPPKLHMNPTEIKDWIRDQVMNYHVHDLYRTHMIDRVIYFRFDVVSCNLIEADTKWFEAQLPLLKQFWTYIEFYKKHPNRLNKLVIYVKEIGIDKTKEIFEHVHREYLKFNKKSKYQPLYQTRNPWRVKYDNKIKKIDI